MRCSQCQAENRAGRRFCGQCGAPLASPCPACGFTNEPGERFCGGCGQPVATTGGLAPPPAPPPATVPPHLAEKILTSRSALEGERKLVTILFADLKGSTQLLAGDPEEARALLDPMLEHMIEAVHRYEGLVNQVMGDGIMALFGAPIANEDHAVRACYAALRMQESVRRYAEQVRRSHGVNVQIRVGLNTGEVVVRAIGSDLHMDYTAVGQMTILAARMEQLANPGTTLLTAATLELAEGYIAVKPLGPIPAKGFPDPVEVYELTGAGAAHTRLQATAARGLTRFVGRSEELVLLGRALEQAGQGHGQIVAVVGDPGVGKSRLFHEFTHSHRAQGWHLVASGSVSYGRATSYLPVIDLLKSYFQIEGDDDARRIREKVTGRLMTLDEGLRPTLAPLLTLLDVPVDDPSWQALDPPQRRQHTLDAVRHLLLRESLANPVLLVVEDLHWIDAETQALLDNLVESLPTARLLLLVNYRPEYRHIWGSKSYYAQLRLDALPPESAAELLRALVGTDPTLVPLKRQLIAHTEGNPFFLEEMVRTLVETRVLAGARGAYRLAADSGALHVAPSVQAILAARIDRLPPDEKRLLQSAAVVGKDVPYALLAAVADLSDEELRRGLARLQAAEFLYERSLFPDLELTFKHALTHEVTYSGLLNDRRRALHARIVAAIETQAGDRLDERVERLAHHAVRGDVWDKALHYLRQAYARAMARSAQREAAAYAEQALDALARLPESRDTIEQSIDLRFQLRHALWALGEFGRIRVTLVEAKRLADALGDRRRQGWVALYLCSLHYGAAEHDRAVEAGGRAVARGEELGDQTLLALALVNLGQAHAARTDYERAVEIERRAMELLAGDLLRDRLGQGSLPSVLGRVQLVRALVELGQFDESIAVANEAVRIAEEAGHQGSLAIACIGAGLPYLRQGEAARVIAGFGRGVDISRELGFPTYAHWLAPGLAAGYTLAGQSAEAIPLLEQTLADGAAKGLLSQETLSIIYLGEALLLAGRDAEALERATTALRLATTRNERGYEAFALRLLGNIAAWQDPPGDQAAARYREALRLANDLGMRPLVAHCHLGLGTLSLRTDEPGQAREHLATAATLYRELGMAFWLEQTEAALASVDR